ncbi:MAG: ADP-ribosylglycohydrolase family protein [Isosphaeraceae bacterium]|nr:ADP-ribosylglycohydrolase family protein [Isosphaeraceae bacterium]
MPQLNRSDRIRGAMLGLAVGDALGAPLEGLSAQQIRVHYQLVTDYVDGAKAWRRKPYRWRMPGLYTDDTQQALAICEVLVETGRVDVDRLAAIYVELATPDHGYAGAHRGVGRSFKAVLGELKKNVPPLRAGQDSAGIGAAMRIAPVGLYFVDDLDGLFEAVMAAGLMTHRDIRSLAGACAVALGVRRMLLGEPRDPSFALRLAADVAKAEDRIVNEYDGLVDFASTHKRSMSCSIAHVESLLDLSRDKALCAIAEQANRHGAEPICRKPTMGFPPACIPACIYHLLTSENFEESIIDLVNLGGDADSTGAILGAMSGAHFGLEAIPERLLLALQNRDGIDLRAQALARRDATGLEIPDFVATEQALSAQEEACRGFLMSQPEV